MNDILASFILALVQGIAEAFPVSSSAHLVLAAKLLDYPLTLEFIVALHFGTLMAFFIYFSKDIIDMIRDVLTLKWSTHHGNLALCIVIATIPASIAGFFLKDMLESLITNTLLIALGLGITSLLLASASVYKPKTLKTQLTFKTALFIGLAQIASLFRGISRSGSTISTGLFAGLDEKTAVKFSFLMSIPIVFGANILSLGSARLSPNLFLPAILSCLAGLCAIHVSYTYVLNKRENLKWFAIYAGLLALSILILNII